MSTYGIALLTAVAIVFIVYLIDLISGKKALLYMIAGKPILSALTQLAKAVGATTGSEYFNTAYIVMQAATEATEKAENLWKSGSLPKEDRERLAAAMIKDTLQQAGVVVTEQVQQIIDGTIALVCLLLPHYTYKAEVAE